MIKAPKPFHGTHPVTVNEGFRCEKCGKTNPRAQKTCRNHCTECLFSKHVDKNIPGDRESACMGLMEPVRIGYNSKKGFLITHVCMKCGKEAVNKSAPDDNPDKIAKIMERQNTTPIDLSLKKKCRAKPKKS
jgi:DNA-directed RNA polymerase subunit RPC12/RpoP